MGLRLTNRQTGRETDKQTDKRTSTDRQRDAQRPDRHTYIDNLAKRKKKDNKRGERGTQTNPGGESETGKGEGGGGGREKHISTNRLDSQT